MAVVPIIKIPDPILNQKCQVVRQVDEETKRIVQNLKDTLEAAQNPQGAGLSATQIGISKRICIVRRFMTNPETQEETIKEYVLINPEMTSISNAKEIRWEGCLSVPNLLGKVERTKRIKLIALNENGEKVKIEASGFFARVIQHEIDHLDGILFTSKTVGPTITEKELDKLTSDSEVLI